ncbi:MAG: hypothetical protein VKK59_06710 [Vampirovibrionales bacterium]|nr:hypothetical protein [Vampirovibrionales bacterium]
MSDSLASLPGALPVASPSTVSNTLSSRLTPRSRLGLRWRANWLGVPSVSATLERRIGKIQNDVARAQLNLLELSVVGGRSCFAWLRNGFAEFQERLFEELITGIAWINGKPFLEHFYDRSFGQKNASIALAPKVDWSLNRHRQLGLSPLELYTPHGASAEQLLKVKAGRFGLAFVTTLSLVSLIIPVLNQMKTAWLFRHFPGLKNQLKASQKNPPPAQTTTVKPLPNTPSTQGISKNVSSDDGKGASGPLAMPTSAFSLVSNPLRSMPPQQILNKPLNGGFSGFASTLAPPYVSSQPVFGHSPLTNAVSQLGHLYNNVPYGDLIGSDVGMIAGRGYVASKRSGFETVEVMFRDISSDYFYLWSLPHLMAAVGLGLSALSGVDARQDPVVARALLTAAQRKLLPPLSEGSCQKHLLANLETVLRGHPQPALSQAEVSALTRQMTSLPLDELQMMLQKELLAHKLPTDLAKSMLSVSRPYLISHHLNAAGAQAILSHLQNASFKSERALSDSPASLMQEDARRAFKWSMELANPRALAVEHLPKQVQERVELVCKRNGLAKTHTGLRRLLALLSEPSVCPQLPSVLLDELHAYADWLDHAAMRGLSLKEATTEAVSDLIRDIKATSLYDRFMAIEQTMQAAAKQKILPEKLSLNDLTFRSAFSPIANMISSLEQAPQQATVAQVNELTATLQHQQLSQIKPIAQTAKRLLTLLSPDRPLTELPQVMASKLILQAREFSGESHPSEVMFLKFSKLLSHLQSLLPKDTAHTPLIQRYLKFLPDFLQKGSSSFISESPENLAQSIHWIQHGGLVNDPAMGRLALELRHKLAESHRSYLAPKAALKELASLKRYSQTLLKQMARQMHLSGGVMSDVMWQSFRENRRFQYLNYAFALTSSMLGLGVLVPKLQIALNRKLTGRSDHPGLATLVN